MHRENNTIEILLVEDNPDDEELMLLTLEESSPTDRIKIVRDGAEALEYLFATGKYSARDRSRLPKLIFLDLKLPKVSGLEVLEQIKSHDQTNIIPVVILTSSREETDVRRSYQLGANSYVVKPVDFDQFRTAIQQLGAYWQFLNEPPIH